MSNPCFIGVINFPCVMEHMPCVMAPPALTSPVFFVRLSGSQRAAGQGQQGTNSCQVHSPSMHGRVCGRSRALRLRCETGHEVAVNCTIQSRGFSSELRVATSLAELGFYDRKQPLEDIAAGLRFEMSERAFDCNICK